MATEPPASSPRVLVVAPMPPEKAAYALARYSRSPDSIVQSLDWVRGHSAEKFLDTFYFQYGHASIADLGHCTMCFEGISELAAIEVEDEQLWDGQAKSTRYQDLSGSRAVIPEDLRGTPHEDTYLRAARAQLRCYTDSHAVLVASLSDANPKPRSMSVARYRRTINARAFDVARYLLLAGLPTNVGQVTSIRTLEKQMRRMGVSEYPEVRSIAEEMHAACGAVPGCSLDADSPGDPLAPTLAKYADPDTAREQALGRVAAWARQNFSAAPGEAPHDVDLVRPSDTLDEAAATWLYAVTASPFRVVLDTVSTWSSARKSEVLEAALQDRNPREDLLRPFHSGYRYIFDIVCDLGAYRDLHRHRRCQQVRQRFGNASLGHETPEELAQVGLQPAYDQALAKLAESRAEIGSFSESASHYLLPFAARCRSLFKMDFAEAEYIARVRSGVKGHPSYRKVAWEMRQRICEVEPELGRLINATHPSVQDTLKR